MTNTHLGEVVGSLSKRTCGQKWTQAKKNASVFSCVILSLTQTTNKQQHDLFMKLQKTNISLLLLLLSWRLHFKVIWLRLFTRLLHQHEVAAISVIKSHLLMIQMANNNNYNKISCYYISSSSHHLHHYQWKCEWKTLPLELPEADIEVHDQVVF